MPAEPRGRTGPRRRVPSELPRERSRGLTEPGKLPARSSQEHRFLAAMRSVLARRDAPRPVFGPVKQRRDASVISHVNKSLRRAPLLFQRKCRAENGPAGPPGAAHRFSPRRPQPRSREPFRSAGRAEGPPTCGGCGSSRPAAVRGAPGTAGSGTPRPERGPGAAPGGPPLIFRSAAAPPLASDHPNADELRSSPS